MRNPIVLGLVAIALLVLAFVGGLYMQRYMQVLQIRSAEKIAREFTGLDDPIPPAPDWESWRYPQAKVIAKIEGQTLRVMGKLERPGGHYAILVTPDSLEDVAKFYAEKAQFENPDAAAKSEAATSTTSTLQGKSEYVLDDSLTATNGPNQKRTVRVKCLAARNPSYAVSAIITRASDDQQTHIVLLYDPLVETVPTAERP